MLSWEAWFSLSIALFLLLGLALRIASTDLLAMACLGMLAVVGDLSGSPLLPDLPELVAGFGNPALVTVGLLFAVVAGLELTGGTDLATSWLLKRPRNLLDAQLRLLTPVATSRPF